MKPKMNPQQLVSLLPGHVYWKDADGYMHGCNEEQARFLGFKSSAEVIGKTDYDITDKKKADLIRVMDDRIIQSGVGEIQEEVFVKKDGEEIVFLSKKEPWRDNDGKVIGILGVSIDITDSKRAKKLQSEKKAAEKVTSFANMIAGSIAHELRTPLAIINLQMDLMYNAILSDKTQDETEAFCKNTIKIVKNTVSDTNHVISNLLLKIKSFASGKITGDFEVVSLVGDIENVLDCYPFTKDEISSKLITVKYTDRVKYFGDPVFTRNIIVNLLKNSLQAIKEAGKGDITIELKAGDEKDNFNYLIFEDTAIGIPKEFVSKIFERYKTGNSSSGGTGLGLMFCKMVMESYGGDITCDSKEGKYTRFKLSFPKVENSLASFS